MLLAEDNPGDVYLVDTALKSEKLDAELLVATDGEKMLRMLETIESGEAERPDVVLLDLNLPRYSGAQLLEKMRNSAACREIPVIIMTSSDAPCDRDVAERLRASGYFRKPSDFPGFMRLGSLVRAIAGGGYSVS